jgi:hypothetical protein
MSGAEKAIAEERERRAEWEACTVVTPEGETIADLRDAFDRVCNAGDWKAPWAAYVPAGLVGRVCRAVEFFHADVARMVGIQRVTGRVILEGRGYQG